MRVRLSVNSGFCWGVKRAFDKVLGELAGGEPVHTIGPLVHNENAIRMLEKRGLRTCPDPSEIREGTVVVRAHGIRPELERELLARKLNIVDATCPHVRRIQKKVEDAAAKNMYVCIVGYSDHPEVEALVARAGKSCTVIATERDVHALPTDGPIFLAAQSTFNRSSFDEIRARIEERCSEVTVFDSVCRATGTRQEEVRELARQSEAVVVVGSHTSSNTKRLAEIAAGEGVPTYHVTSADDLDLKEMARFGTVAVASGASTPNWVTRRVVEALMDVSPAGGGGAWLLRKTALGFVESGLYASLGAAALTLTSCRLQDIPVRSEYLAASFFYIFSIYTLNRLQQRHEEPAPTRRAAFLRAHPGFMLALGTVFALAAVGIAFKLGVFPAALIAISYVLGIGYTVPIIPARWGFRYERLQDIPASKDMFAAAAWTGVCCVVPFAHATSAHPVGAIAAAWAFVFLTVSAKATMYESVDIQGDRVLGRETLPSLLGEGGTWLVLSGLITGSGALLVAIAGLTSNWSLLALLAGPAYAATYLPILKRGLVRLENLNVVVVDGQLFILGMLAHFLGGR